MFVSVPALADGSPPESDPHADVFSETAYPSASVCGTCHTQIYDEWASSNHAYASLSPMFHKFEQAITDLSQGTIGSFCVRCHQQIGTQRGEERWLPLWERSQVAREGITCVTCHRVKGYYGKVNGERHVEPGSIHAPVYGTAKDSKFDQVTGESDRLKIALDETQRGTPVHGTVVEFETLEKSEFCVSCHQVAVNLGIKLEVVWEQYRDSPAFRNNVTCQDCHMGKVPGVAAGYETAPTAIVNGEAINPGRKHSNHAFYGPGYPVAHPGIFPHNPDADRWDIEDWLTFDYRSKWGSVDFEDKIADTADAFDSLDVDLAPLGGHVQALSALDALETAMSRGELGFHTERARKRLLTRLEALDGAVTPEDGRVAAERLPGTVRELAASIGREADRFETLVSRAEQMINRVPLAEGFDTAYDELLTALESLPKPVGAEDLDRLRGLVVKLRSAMPGMEPDFQVVLKDIKKALKVDFPAIWADPGDREEAWEIVQVNNVRLEEKRDLRRQVMENGSKIDGPFFDGSPESGEDLSFHYTVTNIDDGHNLPSGSLGAQPEIWLNVALTGPDGTNLWESGYLDSNGDFADIHSLDVAAGTIDFDDQLFNLQTKFLTTNVKGTDREMYLPVNFDQDQRPFLRPSNVPASILNHPPFVRMEGRSLPPLGSRNASYEIPGELLSKPGTYRLSVRLRSRAEPIYFMKFVGATDDMVRSMNEWMLDIHPYTVEFEVK
ncbi:MAG: multiheme c-type cytochrome [Magnetovibrionaceae bacterium]